MMRTTLNLPEDVYQAIRSIALVKGLSLGDAVADLVRKGLDSGVRADETKPFPCFDIRANMTPITLKRTLAAEDEP